MTEFLGAVAHGSGNKLPAIFRNEYGGGRSKASANPSKWLGGSMMAWSWRDWPRLGRDEHREVGSLR